MNNYIRLRVLQLADNRGVAVGTNLDIKPVAFYGGKMKTCDKWNTDVYGNSTCLEYVGGVGGKKLDVGKFNKALNASLISDHSVNLKPYPNSSDYMVGGAQYDSSQQQMMCKDEKTGGADPFRGSKYHKNYSYI
jgi:hypothetical protein